MSSQQAEGQPQEQRVLLAMERAVAHQLDALIRSAGQTILLLRDDHVMRQSQLRNALGVATGIEKESLAATTNFVRYQIGRSGGNQAWLHNDFGHKVISALESDSGIVSRLANAVANELGSIASSVGRDQVFRQARLELARLYLGYLDRWFRYGSAERRNWDDIEAATKESK
jgi:hypothetical protein